MLESYVITTGDKDPALSVMKMTLEQHGSPEVITTGGLRAVPAAMNEFWNGDKQEIGRLIAVRLFG